MQIGSERGELPGDGGPQVGADVPRRRRDPGSRPRARQRPLSSGRRRACFAAAALFALVAAVAGAFASPLARAVAGRGAALRARVRRADGRARPAASRTDAALDGHLPLRARPDLPLLGTFFPIEQLPDWLEPIAWADAAVARRRALPRPRDRRHRRPADAVGHVAYLVAFTVVGAVLAVRLISPEAALVMRPPRHRSARASPGCRSARAAVAPRRAQPGRLPPQLAASSSPGFFEPSSTSSRIGLGVGALVGDVSYGGELVPLQASSSPRRCSRPRR